MAQAGVLYSNNAGTPFVQSFDTTTGAQIFSFTASGGNGRGVVTVGDVVYTTDASTPFIGKFDRLTGAALGGFNVVGAPGGISTISFDGDNFWTSDYTGSNKAYYVQNGTGVVLKTVTLANSTGFYDGLEYFKGKLIANRFDGGIRGGNQYSVYDTDGLDRMGDTNLLPDNPAVRGMVRQVNFLVSVDELTGAEAATAATAATVAEIAPVAAAVAAVAALAAVVEAAPVAALALAPVEAPAEAPVSVCAMPKDGFTNAANAIANTSLGFI
jgi:hypothetical protein